MGVVGVVAGGCFFIVGLGAEREGEGWAGTWLSAGAVRPAGDAVPAAAWERGSLAGGPQPAGCFCQHAQHPPPPPSNSTLLLLAAPWPTSHTHPTPPPRRAGRKRSRLAERPQGQKASAAVVLPSRQIRVENAELLTDWERKRQVRRAGVGSVAGAGGDRAERGGAGLLAQVGLRWAWVG